MTVTSPALPATVVASAATRLRTVLRADAVVTGALGAVAVLAAPSLADLFGTPTVLRVIGAVLLVAAVDIALLARLSGRRLALAGTVVGELALACVAATAVVIALGLANPAGGRAARRRGDGHCGVRGDGAPAGRAAARGRLRRARPAAFSSGG